MFFTKFSAGVAWLTVILSVFQIVVGIAIATLGSPETARDIFGSRGTGRAIDQGMIWLVVGLALGMVSEMSRAIVEKPGE
jgi:hypothetical protein